MESHWPGFTDLRQRGDGETVGNSGLQPRLWLALPAESETSLPGQRRGLVRPAGPGAQAPQHVGRVGGRELAHLLGVLAT